jgi:hypothetical protein
MGEIPKEMHEKITLYNKISDRPLNVSRAIEICMSQAVKKIEEDMVNDARENKDDFNIVNNAWYTVLKKEVEDGLLNSQDIYKLYVGLVKDEGSDTPFAYGKTLLYPIDKVVLGIGIDPDESFERVEFRAKGVFCFAVTALE